MSITELYRVYRPKTFADVVGQGEAVLALQKKIEAGSLNHVVLLHGSTGTGKTTLARIAAKALGCDLNSPNLIEQNTADLRGIDSVREIAEHMWVSPLGGKAAVYILDEVVQLPKTTQQAFLKILEDTPPKTWFFLCTTDTTGLLPTLLGRCLQIGLQPLTEDSLCAIQNRVLALENKRLSIDMLRRIAQQANGSARAALNLLELVLTATDEKAQVQLIGSAISGEDENSEEFLPKLLLKKAAWTKLAAALSKIKDSDAFGLRCQVSAYMNKVLLGAWSSDKDKAIAFVTITAFANVNTAALATAATREIFLQKL